jgi:hypothetical protein
MPYSELTSFQFERGKGFTEDSVLSFRVLALNVIHELLRHDGVTVAHFPLTNDEVRLVLDYRTRQEPDGDDSDGDGDLLSAKPSVLAPSTSQSPTPPASPTPAAAESSMPTESGPAEETFVAAEDLPGQSLPTTDDEFVIAARWLALATRGGYDVHQESPEQNRV